MSKLKREQLGLFIYFICSEVFSRFDDQCVFKFIFVLNMKRLQKDKSFWFLEKFIFQNFHLKYRSKLHSRAVQCRFLFSSTTRPKLKGIEREKINYFGGGIEIHIPGKNFEAKSYIVTDDTKKLLEGHLHRTGGQVRTRFAPEPNGLLHIGHAKAININYGFAQAEDGICYLRYDDTNPEMEEHTFVEGIQEMIKWLGFKSYEISYASDYFEKLYQWAEELILKDLAYVCHESPSAVRSENLSPWRLRHPNESLQEFREMKNRKYREGEATLRLKMTTDQKTVHPVAYRIKYTPHHRTKEDWCIYPTYDFAHSLCDSIQDITHSLCTTEFTLRRSTYYWVCNAVGTYCPVQIEYGRLQLLYTVVSKRKISALIQAGFVRGWDDPRLYTLSALKRRGIPPESINDFCKNFGLKTEKSFVNPNQFDHYVREHLGKSSTRIMAVVKPLKVIIKNYPYEQPAQLRVMNVRGDEVKGFHAVTFDREIWIEESDFQETPGKGYRRLAPNQNVGLKYTHHVITLTRIVRSPSGDLEYLEVECTPLGDAKKPKAFIHWVAHPLEAELRLYENLFKSERPDDPKAVPAGFLTDINPNSLTITKALIGESSLGQFLPYQRFQFERVGFFVVDPDSSDKNLVFNRTLKLKQDKGFDQVK